MYVCKRSEIAYRFFDYLTGFCRSLSLIYHCYGLLHVIKHVFVAGEIEMLRYKILKITNLLHRGCLLKENRNIRDPGVFEPHWDRFLFFRISFGLDACYFFLIFFWNEFFLNKKFPKICPYKC